MSQDGGCDHTIGCGYDHAVIEANDMQDAFEKAQQYLDETERLERDDFGTSHVDACEIYPLSGDSQYLPLEEWRAELKAQRAQELEDANKRARRAQYEALKREFDG